MRDTQRLFERTIDKLLKGVWKILIMMKMNLKWVLR